MSTTPLKSEHESNDSLLHMLVNWQNLRGFAQSKIGSISLVTPFIGYAILYHDKLQPYFGGFGGFFGLAGDNTDVQACAPWITTIDRLHLIYIGTLLIGLGTLVFRICANRVIKDFSNIIEFVERESQTMTARNLIDMHSALSVKRPLLAAQLVEIAPWLDSGATLKTTATGLANDTKSVLLHDLMCSYHNAMSKYDKRLAVYLASILYAFGFSSLAVPGITFTGRVVCAIFH